MNNSYIQTLVDENIKTVAVAFCGIALQDDGKPLFRSTSRPTKKKVRRRSYDELDEDLEDEETSPTYVYKTKLDLKEGDIAICPTKSGIGFGRVVEVHEDPAIGPDDEYDFQWITQTVDLEGFVAARAEDLAFAKELRKRQRKASREGAREKMAELFGDEPLTLETSSTKEAS